MSNQISHKFVLVGSLAGKSINLGGHDFVDGTYEFVNVIDGRPSMPSQDDIKLKAVNLARNYQAFPEDSLELASALEALDQGVDVLDSSTPDEREQEEQRLRDAAPVEARRIATATREALIKLDAKDDLHWTQAGLPSVEAIRSITGVAEVTRADINALAPNLNREEAAKLQNVDLTKLAK